MPIVGTILYQARRLVVGRLRGNHVADNLRSQFSDRRCIKRSGVLFAYPEDASHSSRRLSRSIKCRRGDRRASDELSSTDARHAEPPTETVFSAKVTKSLQIDRETMPSYVSLENRKNRMV